MSVHAIHQQVEPQSATKAQAPSNFIFTSDSNYATASIDADPAPAPATGAATAGNGTRLAAAHPLKCSVCSKVFKRSEHCARHELSHTDERPFSCQFCHKSYARKDLVKRHERTIHADLYNVMLTQAGRADDKPETGAALNTLEPRPVIHVRTSSAELHQGNAATATIATATNGIVDVDADADAVASRIRDFGVLDDETFLLQTHATSASRPTTLSGTSNNNTTTAATFASSTELPSLFSPRAAGECSDVDARYPDARVRTESSTADSKLPRLSSAQSSVPSNDQFDFSIGEFLATAPSSALLSFDGRVNAYDNEMPHSKRQRLSMDDSPMLDLQNDLSMQSTASPALPGSSINALPPSNLLDIDFMMGGLSNEFFFRHINQQYDRPTYGDTHAVDFVGMPVASSLAFPDAMEPSPSARFSDSFNEGGAEKGERKVRLPMILKEKSQNPPRLIVGDAAFDALSADFSEHLGKSETRFPLKNRRELQHFLNGYLDCFHRHLPLLHLPTLIRTQMPSSLILAMCCIGALYRLDRRKARSIYLAAAVVSESLNARYSQPPPCTPDSPLPSEEEDANHAVVPKPLWLMQARILLVLYAALGNDSSIMQAQFGRMGAFIVEFRARRSLLKSRSQQRRKLQWHEWIEIEGTKRLLCAMFICSSLLVLTYDIPPGVGITQDLEFETLDEEKLWSAASAEDWNALRPIESMASQKTIRGVMQDMLAGKTNESGDSSLYYVSGFTTLVAIHGLNMYAWYLSQFSHVYMSPFSDLSGVASNTLLSNAMMTLAKCREVVQLARPEGIESMWNSPEGPLLLNCEAMLRVSYTRLFLSTSMPEGLLLLYNSPKQNVKMLDNFVAAPQERAPLITKVMASMCEAFSVPSKAGYLLVQKTAAINWSVEHAVAGWGCVLLLSKWLHCLDVQLDEAPLTAMELEIVSQVKTALEGMNMEYDERTSLAAAVVSSWAPLMTDVWVWGVTATMGTILKDLAQVYETSSSKASRRRLRS